MEALRNRGLGPEAVNIASQAFSRSWHFIERDPVLAGHDREALQAELALRIQEILHTGRGERDVMRIANQAIGRVREVMLRQQDLFHRVKMAS